MPGEVSPITRIINANGITLAYHEWAGASGLDQPPLIFAHATGFHGRVWDAIIENFPDRRVLALDMRGHGQSGGGPIDHWQILASDISAFLDQLQIRHAIGIGHSMGAHALLQCAADRADSFSRLVLFDPVIFPPEDYASGLTAFTPENRHPTSRRKRDFPSPEAMIERFRERDPYSLFDPRVFEDYCRYGLVSAPSGEGYELACSPETEASVYESSRSNAAILEAARRVDIPVLMVRAKEASTFDFKSSPTWPGLAASIPQGEDLYRPDRTHFHPLEDPADAARIIASAIAR